MPSHRIPTVLPDDIIRLVIDIFATEADSRNSIFQLLPVSKAFKEWAEPHAYSRLTLRNREQALSFLASLHDEFAFCRPARHVKRLWLLYTDPPVAQSFHDVYSKCPKLMHFSFDGRNTPFVGSRTGCIREKGHLSRLSICSPIFLEDEFFRFGPPISYERLTHLHILAPGGLGDKNFFNEIFGEHLHQLGSLSHLVIEVTYPSPAMRSDKDKIILGDALFNIVLSDGLLRNLFVRVPSLREVVVKSISPYPQFVDLWDKLKTELKDEPRIVFTLQSMDNERKARCESALSDKSAAVCGSAWQDLLVNALDEVDQLWSSKR